MIKPVDKARAGKSLSETVRRHLSAYFKSHGDGIPPPGIYARLMPLVEKPLIEIALAATDGNQIRAAKLLGINRNTLRKKMAALGIGNGRASRPKKRARRS